ncbi:hypothetical protein AB1K70_18905 [Bremerella sp. JC770]|uniref:hypothetical protein n=1 Tax=Bremerella sp. JC770 TaxID=3232137 RepID=UPI003459CB85
MAPIFKVFIVSHHHAPATQAREGCSVEQTPQVAVRDGNRLLCPCCGEVLMVLPEEAPKEPVPPKMPGIMPSPWDKIARRQDTEKEAAWQAYEASEKAKQEALHAQYLASDDPKFCADYLTVPIDPMVAAYEFPAEDPPPLPSPKREKPVRQSGSPVRRQPKRNASEILLDEPLTYQQKRYLAWVYYHLKLEDLTLQKQILAKQAKIECLRRDLGETTDAPSYEAHLPSEDLPKVHPQVEVVDVDLMHWIKRVRENAPHAQERGPPETFLSPLPRRERARVRVS